MSNKEMTVQELEAFCFRLRVGIDSLDQQKQKLVQEYQTRYQQLAQAIQKQEELKAKIIADGVAQDLVNKTPEEKKQEELLKDVKFYQPSTNNGEEK